MFPDKRAWGLLAGKDSQIQRIPGKAWDRRCFLSVLFVYIVLSCHLSSSKYIKVALLFTKFRHFIVPPLSHSASFICSAVTVPRETNYRRVVMPELQEASEGDNMGHQTSPSDV